jgi:hypothetical protein
MPLTPKHFKREQDRPFSCQHPGARPLPIVSVELKSKPEYNSRPRTSKQNMDLKWHCCFSCFLNVLWCGGREN